MDENQKAKMEAMKKQIQRKKQEQELLNNSLYQECLTALKDYVIVQDETDIRYLTSLVSSNDIESHSHSEEVKLADTERYYIVWDNMSVPILESSGKCINDSCIECSEDGVTFKQMRVCHMWNGAGAIRFGIYACSPEDSSFKATFTNMEITECKWLAHDGQQPDKE